MSENDTDKGLLYSNPHGLIEKYQHIIRSIVLRFVGSGMFRAGDVEDTVQQINEKLLSDKIHRMQRYYDASYYVLTYLARIVQNLCIDISRENYKNNAVVSHGDIIEAQTAEMETAIVDSITIGEEVRRLGLILRMFPKNRRKIELFLKIYCRIPVSDVDVEAAYPSVPGIERQAFLSVLGEGLRYKEMMDKEIFMGLSPVVNRMEKKESSIDAHRKWLDSKINEIITLLNSKPNNSTYDRETLKLLLQLYFE